MVYKLYLYDSMQENNGYKGIDYSAYISQGHDMTFNLDDTLEVAEITLYGLNFREEFAPKTKFILEAYDTDDDGNLLFYADYHLEISNDAVSQPIISDDTYFNHNISFIEPIVEAQNRLVDNIAVTYKLKDVNLEVPTTYSEDLPATRNVKSVNNVSGDNYGEWSGFYNWKSRRMGHQFLWVMPNWYTVNVNGVDMLPSEFDWDTLKYYQITDTTTTVEFPVPMLEVKASIHNTKSFQHNGYATIDCVIQKTNRNTGDITTQIIVINPDINDLNEQWIADPMRNTLNYGWIESRPFAGTPTGPTELPYVSSKITKVAESISGKVNRVINFEAEVGYSYDIRFILHTFNETSIAGSGFVDPLGRNFDDIYDKVPAYFGFGQYIGYPVIFTTIYVYTNEPYSYTNSQYPVYGINMVCVAEEDTLKIFTKSAPPQNALNLFQKATLLTQDNKKQTDIKALETPTTFYLEDNDYQELLNTSVVENFYNQKNLFQIYMDCGKYIHARPYARFGADNKYIVKWRRYGQTNQFESTSQPISIFNSKFIEEYIGAISSYVTNMVQLGGQIVETVAPKSSSEDYLVYNDVAQIILSKPIIEIINVVAINSDSNERDITEYVYEKGIYQLLPVTRTPLPQVHYNEFADFPVTGVANVIYIADDTGIYYAWDETTSAYNSIDFDTYKEVSKGLAVYYQLGDNKIQGLNYRMPTINTGDKENDYAIKRILGKEFLIADVTNIRVNDYTFRITYRTKDTLRANQARPDLRKYLLASKYDKFPQHNQFNNQEDTLVDSVKFGNNTYGKLIRTGNTIYTYNEVCTALSQLKQVGQLYNIDSNLYYVSKVRNTYFTSHILSQVEFSKDFNRLSQIIGIPSEPRFYEISEQSSIIREKTFDDFIVLGTEIKSETLDGAYIRESGLEYVKDLLFDNETYPQYAVTYFKNDINSTDPTYPNRENFSIDVCHPISTYSMENTLTMEWDMVDNFSAGDKVVETGKSITTNGNLLDSITGVLGESVVDIIYSGASEVDTAYNTLVPVQYCDANGRADLVDFAIVKEFEPSQEQTRELPENPIDLTTTDYLFGNQEPTDFGGNNSGDILLKDNREVVKLNYNLQMLTDSDRFVISAYMWQKEKTGIKLGLLKNEINKISNDTILNTDFVVEDIDFTASIVGETIEIDIETALDEIDLTGINAIVVYSTAQINNIAESGAKYFIFGRNIGGLTEEQAKENWYISYYNKDMFQHQ